MIWIALLAFGASGAAVLCHNRRALAWIACGALSFALTLAWEYSELPYHAGICALADTAQCLLIYFFGRYKWELALYRVWQASILLGIMRFFGAITSQYVFVLSLELCNWAALAVIVAPKYTAKLSDVAPDWPWPNRHLHRALRALRETRTETPWHKVHL